MLMGRGGNIAPEGQHPVRHGLAFVISGATAFAVDATVLALLTAVLDLHPIFARLFAIALAMVAGWLMHRTFTFTVAAPPSFAEFARYAGVAWTAAAINYGIFVAIMLIEPEFEPLAALVISSLASMIFSYLGMRFGAFRRRSADPGA
jgi:putative flippase GtrA